MPRGAVFKPILASELDYPFEALAIGTTREVAPGVLWVRMPLPFALDHINLWLVSDGAHWTLVDCGLATDTTRALWEAIFARDLAGRKLGRLIVTHYHPDHHPDHMGLAGWLSARLNLIPWMTKGEFLTAHAACHNVGGTGYARVREFFARHGLRGIHARVAELKAHHAARLEALAKVCDQEKTAAELLPALFRREFKDYQLLFAMGETIAHLNHLWHQRVLQRVRGSDDVWRFVRAG